MHFQKTYLHGQPLLSEIISLTILVDFIQFNLHLLEHKLHFKSHSIHHRKTTPSCCDAFHTGIFDAALQLVLPIYIAICVVDPNKTSLIAFGCFYAYWLQWIHSNSPYALSIKSSFFVTPSYHRIHHQQPTKNLSHVFIIWDQLLRLVVWWISVANVAFLQHLQQTQKLIFHRKVVVTTSAKKF